jgi:hypothetical protein
MRVEVTSHGYEILTIRSPIIESDTAGEFALEVRRPDPGQVGVSREARTGTINDLSEFASSIESAGEPVLGALTKRLSRILDEDGRFSTRTHREIPADRRASVLPEGPVH